MASMAPPGGKGTIQRMGLLGQLASGACAWAAGITADRHRPAAAAVRKRRFTFTSVVSEKICLGFGCAQAMGEGCLSSGGARVSLLGENGRALHHPRRPLVGGPA